MTERVMLEGRLVLGDGWLCNCCRAHRYEVGTEQLEFVLEGFEGKWVRITVEQLPEPARMAEYPGVDPT